MTSTNPQYNPSLSLSPSVNLGVSVGGVFLIPGQGAGQGLASELAQPNEGKAKPNKKHGKQ